MKCTIAINMDNAAFDEGRADLELVGILENIQDGLLRMGADPDSHMNLLDSNGNRVGEMKITED